jgi:tRNA G18 (ribose-2'-O)-methylase SpoU
MVARISWQDASAASSSESLLPYFQDLTDVQLRTILEPSLGVFMAEGALVIERALHSGHQPIAALCEEKWLPSIDHLMPADTPVILASREEMAGLTGFDVHRGAMAVMSRKPLLEVERLLESTRRVVYLEGLVNHTNVGAIFRSAAAMRMDAVFIDPQCADPLYRRSVRVSMGTVFSIPWTRVDSLESFVAAARSQGMAIIALTPEPSAMDIRDLPAVAKDRCAVIMGTEGEGLTSDSLDGADFAVRIPMSDGIDSLNVAAAAAVAFYEVNRDRLG